MQGRGRDHLHPRDVGRKQCEKRAWERAARAGRLFWLCTAEATIIIGPLKTEAGEEEYVQVIMSLMNVLLWRMRATA